MESTSPLITTIIPTYRRPRLLKRAVRSVLNQTFHHLQVCVYDNASGDETAEMVADLAKQDHRVKYHCQPENIGARSNFKFGMANVDTPYFSFLSDDDFLLPDFYETALEGFQNFPDAAFSAGSVITMTDSGKVLYAPLSLWSKEGYFSPPEGLLEIIGEKHPIWTGILFRRSIIENVGVLDPEVGSIDLDFVFRIAAHYPFVISKKPCAVCVNHPSSSSALPNLNDVWPGWLKMIRNLTEDKQIPANIRTIFEQKLLAEIKKMIFWIGVRSIPAGKYQQALDTAQVLNDHFRLKSKAQLLNLLANICQRSRLIHQTFVLVLNLRRYVMSYARRDRARLQAEYAHLSKLTDGPS